MGAPPTNALDTAPLSIGADVYGMSWEICDQIYDFRPADLIEFSWLEIVKWLSKDYGNWFPCTKQGHGIIITDKY